MGPRVTCQHYKIVMLEAGHVRPTLEAVLPLYTGDALTKPSYSDDADTFFTSIVRFQSILFHIRHTQFVEQKSCSGITD